MKFTLDDLGRVTEEREVYGYLISSIEWGENLPYIYHYGDKMYRYKCNAHGDVVALLDESGQTVNSYSYDIFGKSLRTEEQLFLQYYGLAPLRPLDLAIALSKQEPEGLVYLSLLR